MSHLLNFVGILREKESLTGDQAEQAARELAGESVDPREKKAFLLALAEKGETVDEVVAFAKVFRSLALDPGLEEFATRGIDVVGTGGSGSGGYNISSVTAFALAASGIPVLKHGNRAITSRSGSADFMDMAGIKVTDDSRLLRESLEQLNFCFFFAPLFHPAFRNIVPVRKELADEGRRSIFNILGPLINPARPAHQLLGVFSKEWVVPLAETLTEVGVRRGISVHSLTGDGRRMDEWTTAGTNTYAGIGELAEERGTVGPMGFGFVPANPQDLIGGTAVENWQILQDIIKGSGRPGLIDSICLNIASALYILEKADSINEGLLMAREMLLDGRLRRWLARVREFHLDWPDAP